MKLLKKLKKSMKKSDTKRKFKKILKELEARRTWLEKQLDGMHTEEDLEELHKEYDALQRLIHKCKKRVKSYSTL